MIRYGTSVRRWDLGVGGMGFLRARALARWWSGGAQVQTWRRRWAWSAPDRRKRDASRWTLVPRWCRRRSDGEHGPINADRRKKAEEGPELPSISIFSENVLFGTTPAWKEWPKPHRRHGTAPGNWSKNKVAASPKPVGQEGPEKSINGDGHQRGLILLGTSCKIEAVQKFDSTQIEILNGIVRTHESTRRKLERPALDLLSKPPKSYGSDN